MEKNLKITDVKTITKDGQIYVEYATISKDGTKLIHERPMYNEKGEIDPEVNSLLELAKKMDSKENALNEEEKLEEVFAEEEVEQDVQPVAVVPTNKGTVTVYQEPENAELQKEGFFAKNKRLIAVGLAGILVGLVITKACDKINKPKNTDTKKDEVITDISEDAKIKYFTKEEFINGANKFNAHLKEKVNSNYSANDLYSFYYVANLENVSTDLFEELVSEGYIPDTDTGILANALKITTVISNNSSLTGVSSIDYNYLFVSEEAVEKATYWQGQFNGMKDASKEDCETVVANLENYWVISGGTSANNLPVGTKEVIGLIEGVPVTIQAANKGIQPSDALMDGVTNIGPICIEIKSDFNYVAVNETEKQLTK